MNIAVRSPSSIRTVFPRQSVSIAKRARLYDPIRDPINLFLACGLSSLIICGMVAAQNDLLHWFLLPVFVCGALIGADMVAWLRNEVDIFDPLGILGIFGYFFYFVAPLLAVMWNYHLRGLPEPPNWADWVGWLGVINAFGLVLYLVSRQLFAPLSLRTVWRIKPAFFFAATAVALPVTLGCELYVYAKFGGVLGLMTQFSAKNDTVFQGMGWLFMLGDSFPVLLAFLLLIWKRDYFRKRSWWYIAALFIAFFLLKLLCGGLRGSRSTTIWALFWLCGAVHLWIRRLPRLFMAVGLLFLLGFMYVYGFYKDAGVRAVDAIGNQMEADRIQERSGRNWREILMSEFARTEIQSYLLYRLATTSDYDYGLGETYVLAAEDMVPRFILPHKTEGKARKATELINGSGSYDSRLSRASMVYGLTGEMMLNFPPILAPLSLVLLGFVVAKARGLILADRNDLRWLIVPMVCNFVVVLVIGDADNLLPFLLLSSFPFVLLRASCVAVPR